MTDLIFTVGGLVFLVALIPLVVSKRAFAPRATSVPTALVLTVFVFNYLHIHLYYSASVGAITALLWWFIALKRGLVLTYDK